MPGQSTEVSLLPPNRSHLLKRQMPGLDSLRGVAVLSVVLFHGIAFQPRAWDDLPRPHSAQVLMNLTSGGWLGVNLFFVLSGFLITGILLDTRERSNYWSSFYVRRVLRIFPLYLAVLILLRFQIHAQWNYLLLCFLYAANLTRFLSGMGPEFGPLWSLAVEEQFYLVWPLVIRRFNRRTVTIVCIALIVVSPILRGLAVGRFHWLGDSYSSTWLLSDNLAWGAILAIYLRSAAASSTAVRRLTLALGISGVGLMGVLARLHMLSRVSAQGAALQLVPFLMLFTAGLLLALRFGDHPAVLAVTAPLRFFGYISYGLYLLHLIVYTWFDHLASTGAVKVLTLGTILDRFFFGFLVSTAICLLSRRYFEEWFLQLKEKLVPNRTVARPQAVAD